MVLQLKLLGSFEARNGGSERLTFPTKKAKALFAYLALEQGQPHTREKLSNLFWGEACDERARANLRQALTRVRQALPASLSDCVMAHNGTIQLKSSAIRTDTSEFEHSMDDGTIESLERAAALYRGDLLEGFLVHEETFEGWLRHERQRYRERAIACFEALLEHYQGFGASTRGIEICNRLLTLDPYREPIHRLLMNFYADQDRRGAALAQFEECRGLLRDELDVEPEEETTALYEAIRDSSVKTRYTRNPVLSRPSAAPGFGRDRSSRAVTKLVSRSPWRGASWTKPSVAVLPFDCLAGDGANRYLFDVIVEDIITNLTLYQDIHVIARNSSFAYGNQKPDINKIGEELGVRYIVEGSLQREGDSVRVTAQLIEAQGGVHVWAERYDENISGLAGLRDELTGRIAGVLVGRIEQHQLKGIRTRQPEQWLAAWHGPSAQGQPGQCRGVQSVFRARPDHRSGLCARPCRARYELVQSLELFKLGVMVEARGQGAGPCHEGLGPGRRGSPCPLHPRDHFTVHTGFRPGALSSRKGRADQSE